MSAIASIAVDDGFRTARGVLFDSVIHRLGCAGITVRNFEDQHFFRATRHMRKRRRRIAHHSNLPPKDKKSVGKVKEQTSQIFRRLSRNSRDDTP